MATLTRPLVLAAVLLGLFVVAAPALLRNAPDLRDRLTATANDRGAAAQSASQISAVEFAQVQEGLSSDALRALAGEPASKSSAEVEGIRLECWYYGVAGATGAYQLCFKNGRLTSKLRFEGG